MSGTDARRAAETVWRMESASIVAVASRVVGDVGLGEEIAQDAFVAALEQWPAQGAPPNPAGWLVSTARHLAIDLVRRRSTYARKLAEVGRSLPEVEVIDVDDALDDHIGDDLLRLIFTACHPVLSAESQLALTLRMLGGLRADEIARALFTSEATVSQRILRAKRTLAKEGVQFELPPRAELPGRLAAVLG
ncbi:MAG TPA: sigma-70 family RNA polymerase sigma factor, partial [Lapillicoccus sp.]|nr:sigma-70 family RNA polymerase sigma factor [Lapillicoccus sp.]